MTDSGVILAAVVVLVIGTGTGLAWHRGRKKRNDGTQPQSARSASSDLAAIERMRDAMNELLRGVSGNIDEMHGDSQRYGHALAEHRESLMRTATIEDLRELETRLLEQVKEVETANARYRQELDRANRKVEAQQEELGRLQVRANIDFLTELPNRRQLEERLKEFVSSAERYEHSFSIVVFDIDHFKRINDTHGHAAGDRVLRATAKMLNDTKRASDFLARYGGEEFLMVLPETPAKDAERLAERARKEIEEAHFQLQQKSIRVTISAGVGELAVGKEKVGELFERVDKALYFAKQEGRNRVYAAEAPAE